MLYQRLLTFILLIILAFILPWWLILILLIWPFFYFNYPPFFEGLLIGFLLDMLYGASVISFPARAALTATTFILFFLISLLKKRLLFYR